MTAHDTDRIHWNAVLKIINNTEDQSIAIYELAEKMNVALDSNYLDTAIQQLINQGKVRIVLGKHDRFGVCKFINLLVPRKSRREMIDDAEEYSKENNV